jgi:tetratricopeptide (TPR) repeat protein
MGICAQCHLQGEERIVRRGRELNDFRPGLPLQQFLTIFVRHPEFNDLQRSVSQFEQLQESRCFVASRGTLDCVSCHDPHTQPTYEQRERFFNGKCAKCHSPGSTECSERLVVRRAKDHNCLTCHMPRSASSNIVHASIIDHRILRSPNSEGPGKLMPVNSAPLVLFRIGPHSELDADRERDLGIALSRALVEIPQRDARAIQYVSSLAEKRLSFAVSRWRGDGPAWLALSIAKQKKGDLMGGLEAAETAVEMSSEGDVARSNLISALASAGRYDQAIEVATLLVKNNPTAIEPLLQRAEIH